MFAGTKLAVLRVYAVSDNLGPSLTSSVSIFSSLEFVHWLLYAISAPEIRAINIIPKVVRVVTFGFQNKLLRSLLSGGRHLRIQEIAYFKSS